MLFYALLNLQSNPSSLQPKKKNHIRKCRVDFMQYTNPNYYDTRNLSILNMNLEISGVVADQFVTGNYQ